MPKLLSVLYKQDHALTFLQHAILHGRQNYVQTFLMRLGLRPGTLTSVRQDCARSSAATTIGKGCPTSLQGGKKGNGSAIESYCRLSANGPGWTRQQQHTCDFLFGRIELCVACLGAYHCILAVRLCSILHQLNKPTLQILDSRNLRPPYVSLSHIVHTDCLMHILFE